MIHAFVTLLAFVIGAIPMQAPQRLRLHVSCQGDFWGSGGRRAYLGRCVIDDVMTVHGTAVECNTGDSLATFLGKSAGQIDTSLATYFSTNRPHISLSSGATFILDMEQPAAVFVHPNDLWQLSAADQLSVVAAWKLRIQRFKALLPNALVGMYATLVPNAEGDPLGADYPAQLAALQFAGTTAGGALYDDLDWLVPICYQRFGPLDAASKWGTRELFYRMAIDDSRTLLQSDGTVLPLMPLYSTRIHNGNSVHHDILVQDLPRLKSGASATTPTANTERLLDRTWGKLKAICIERGVSDLCLWVGGPDPGVGDEIVGSESNPNGWRVRDWFSC